MAEDKSIIKTIEEVCEDMCSNYCKYSDKCWTRDKKGELELIPECDSCPLNRLN